MVFSKSEYLLDNSWTNHEESKFYFSFQKKRHWGFFSGSYMFWKNVFT